MFDAKGTDLKTIKIKGYTIYKDLFSQKFAQNLGNKTYFLNDFDINTTDENLSYKYVEKQDIEIIYHKFMYEKFGQEYVDAYKNIEKMFWQAIINSTIPQPKKQLKK